jgi:hypothetical protein
LGTALFLVMVMKSCINLWNEQGNIIWYGLPTIISALAAYLLIQPKYSGVYPGVLFVDFKKKQVTMNEFVSLALPLLKQQPGLLLCTLVYIIAATGAVITNRQSTLAPTTDTKRYGRFDVFQSVREYLFSIHKNIIHPFTPTN